MKASDLFVKALENEGVTHIFGIPGEENLDFLNSLKDSSIQLVLNRHEQGAGFMAATYGRLTGKPGVCLSTLGPGATNFLTPAAYAQLGAMPMVMLTGQKPIKKSKQGRFQIVDIVQTMGPVTKYARQIVNANNIPSVVREAFRLAAQERPGAVHIELPEDIAAEEAEERYFKVNRIRRPDADEKAIHQAIEMIHQADRPLLLVGAGANRKRTGAALQRFLEQTKIPFFNTQMGKGVVDERHPLFLGTAALSDSDYLHCAIDRADLIINVGHDVIEKPPFFMEHGGKKVVHVNFFSAEVDDVYFPQLEVVGDIATSVDRIGKLVTPQEHWQLDYFERVKEEIELHIKEKRGNDAFPVIPQHVVHVVRDAMPSDGIVTLDNGIYKIWFARNYKCHGPNTLLLDNALATMGAGLPSAMAAKLVHPERKVVTVCGDGGFMMNSQELETAVRMGLDLVVIILNDEAYGMIKWKQSGMGFDNFGLDYKNPDFVKYAESYGAHGYRPESSEDFHTTLTECLEKPGVHLIDLAVDYSENEKVLIEELNAKTCLL
ncbi:MAG: acetolactate synthase large subunit [Salibacteraceae bacterium]